MMHTTNSILPHLRTISIAAVADGVYAAISVPGQGAMGNAGIIDLGDATLIFDTLRTPAAAEELRRAAECLTGRLVAWVVNSHWHDDHVAGNQVFRATASAILTTERTRELMATRLTAEYIQDAAEMPDFLRSLHDQLAAATDPLQRERLSVRLAENQVYAEAIPAIEVTLPNVTFESRLVLHGALRSVELLTYGGGHTESDVFLHLPAERIAFMGDLAFLNFHPWLPDGDPDEWVRILERIERLPLQTVIPGHGPVSDITCLELTRQYITALQALAREAAESGAWEEKIRALDVPAPFDTWGFPHFFDTNLRFLVQSALRGPATA